MSNSRANYLYPAIGMGLILASIIFVVIAVPRMTFMAQVEAPENAPKDLRNYTAQELRGREIYKREGCWYCHSQVSRPQDWDHGPRSKASDYYYDEYHLVGSERTGPDLANIGGKFPDQYHMLHHQNPRYVKPGSNMPRFDYLSEQELIDLTAYIQGMGVWGTRAKDTETGQLKYAHLEPYTWTSGPFKGTTETLAKWNFSPEQWDKLNIARYEEHLEVPYKYKAEIEEFMFGSSHEAQNARGTLLNIVDKNKVDGIDVTEEALEKKREENRNFPAWVEKDFKEPAVEPSDPNELKTLLAKRKYANYGKGLFNSECSACHGLEGNGHGQAAFGMTKRPANFHEDKFANYQVDTWYWRISRGVPATQMPRWEYTLSPEQRLTLAAFLKYVAQNKGLGKLKGVESDYGKMPSQAMPALPPSFSTPASEIPKVSPAPSVKPSPAPGK